MSEVIKPIAEGKKGLLDKALSIFSQVKAGEGATALLLAANVFLLLASYYLLKTVREALILSESGAEIKSYAAAGQALLLLAVVPAYGAFAGKVNRIRLITWVTLFPSLTSESSMSWASRAYRLAWPFFCGLAFSMSW